jgi:hypothetical protein
MGNGTTDKGCDTVTFHKKGAFPEAIFNIFADLCWAGSAFTS